MNGNLSRDNVIKSDGHLRTPWTCRKHESLAVFTVFEIHLKIWLFLALQDFEKWPYMV